MCNGLYRNRSPGVKFLDWKSAFANFSIYNCKTCKATNSWRDGALRAESNYFNLPICTCCSCQI